MLDIKDCINVVKDYKSDIISGRYDGKLALSLHEVNSILESTDIPIYRRSSQEVITMEEDDKISEDDKIPCDDCDFHCDAWDARYCCTLCQFYDEHPDCELCDQWIFERRMYGSVNKLVRR